VGAFLIETAGFRKVTPVASYVPQVVDRPGHANPIPEFAQNRHSLFE
jgi:hypothetical protein